jgi:hypothetical protein
MADTWRDQARPLIDAAITEGRKRGLKDRELATFVREAFPWGSREMHPYRIWLSEVRVQLKIKTPAEMKKAEAKGLPLFGEEESE